MKVFEYHVGKSKVDWEGRGISKDWRRKSNQIEFHMRKIKHILPEVIKSFILSVTAST